MQVRMVKEVLSPGVKDGEKADAGAEVLWIGGDGQEGPGGCGEQEPVEEPFVLGRGRPTGPEE